MVRFLLLVFLVILWASVEVAGQCSGIGHMCMRTTDCCRGCCEGYQCVERSFPCSTDIGINTVGSASCDKYFCPAGQLCFMVEVCTPEKRCPRQPSCRTYTHDTRPQVNPWRNSSPSSRQPCFLVLVFLTILLVMK